MLIGLIKLIITAVCKAWHQKWKFVSYVFRRYRSGDVTTISFQFVLLCCAASSQLWNDSVFTPIAALLQAVLQANTEPFRNGLVETRNRTEKTSRNHSTGPKRSKHGFWSWSMNFCTILCNQTNYYYYYFPILEICLTFCLCYHLLRRRGNRQFDVHFWRARFVLFPSKDGKDAAYEGRIGWKGVYFPPESASFVFVVNMIKVLFLICTSTWYNSTFLNDSHSPSYGIGERNTFVTWSIQNNISLFKCNR